MFPKALVGCLFFSRVFGNRISTNFAHNETKAASTLCSRWLVVEYNSGLDKKVEDAVFGSFRFLENTWDNVKIFQKHESGGCVKTYYANCTYGALSVTTMCPGGATSEESRCLGGWDCIASSRRSDLKNGETVAVFDPEGSRVMTAGGVKVYTIDPNKGITLHDAPGAYTWKSEWGCYCCKHNYVNPLDNPFAMTSRRLAWHRGDDGNMECMLAWKMIGNAMGDDPVNAPAWAVFALIPEFVLTAADMMTLTIGRHLACAATCPLRKAEFEANKYAYTKIQTGMDKY
eukprot:TRINITY_DN26523_c0_g1_i1.p1 TRINITY_DN26523_c0_g1~~TRINITY_DN26523_c0_g1_i1.p1  ORF type:complete len:302 (+),score=47.17 TRINITY_DN26523_c0_g1_i1:48-908(+)